MLPGPQAVDLGEALTQAIKWGFTARGELTPAVLLDFAIAVNTAKRASTSRSLRRSGPVAESGKSPGDVTGAVSAQTVRVSEAARLAGVSDRWLREQILRGSVSALRVREARCWSGLTVWPRGSRPGTGRRTSRKGRPDASPR